MWYQILKSTPRGRLTQWYPTLLAECIEETKKSMKTTVNTQCCPCHNLLYMLQTWGSFGISTSIGRELHSKENHSLGPSSSPDNCLTTICEPRGGLLRTIASPKPTQMQATELGPEAIVQQEDISRL